MSTPRVLVLFNEPVLPAGHPDAESEAEVLYSTKIVRESLTAKGLPNAEFGVTDDIPRLLDRLAARDFDVVFNLYEGAGDRSVTEVYLTGLLEWLGVSYTGCPSFTLTVARDKPIAKRLFAGAGVRTPEFVLLDSPDERADSVGFPAIVKPASEDASIGIDQGSVVSTPAELRDRVRLVYDRYGPPVLVERYIAGRELQVSLVDLTGTGDPAVLPFSEIAFTREPGSGLWPVYTYTAKWNEQSDEYKLAPVVVGVTLPPAVEADLVATVKRAYRLLGCRDYARVDTRIDLDGNVYVLELNPNPSITSVMLDEGLPKVGSTYDGFIAAMVRNAAARATRPAGSRRVL
jgi:D-alanine-D-alanine ligase